MNLHDFFTTTACTSKLHDCPPWAITAAGIYTSTSLKQVIKYKSHIKSRAQMAHSGSCHRWLKSQTIAHSLTHSLYTDLQVPSAEPQLKSPIIMVGSSCSFTGNSLVSKSQYHDSSQVIAFTFPSLVYDIKHVTKKPATFTANFQTDVCI